MKQIYSIISNKLNLFLLNLIPEEKINTNIFLILLSQSEIIKYIDSNRNISIKAVVSRICDDVVFLEVFVKNLAVVLFNYFDIKFTNNGTIDNVSFDNNYANQNVFLYGQELSNV